MSTSGAPLRLVVPLVKPVGLHADIASPFASAPVLQVASDGGGRRVVAWLKGKGPSEALGLSGSNEIESDSPATTEPRPYEPSDSGEFIPTVHDPNPEGTFIGTSWSSNIWSANSPSHERLEATNHVLIGHANLQARLEASFVATPSGNSDIPLSFKESGAPSDFGIGRFIHAAIVAPPAAVFNSFTATSLITTEV